MRDMSLRNCADCNNRCILVTRKMYEVSQMTTTLAYTTDINELVNHLRALTSELTALHGNLYWLAMQAGDSSEKKAPAAELNVELLTTLKGAVDNMRLLLWDYLETASEVDPEKVREGMDAQKVQRVAQFLQLLRDRLGRAPAEQPLSFIERISATVKQRLGDKVA